MSFLKPNPPRAIFGDAERAGFFQQQQYRRNIQGSTVASNRGTTPRQQYATQSYTDLRYSPNLTKVGTYSRQLGPLQDRFADMRFNQNVQYDQQSNHVINTGQQHQPLRQFKAAPYPGPHNQVLEYQPSRVYNHHTEGQAFQKQHSISLQEPTYHHDWQRQQQVLNPSHKQLTKAECTPSSYQQHMLLQQHKIFNSPQQQSFYEPKTNGEASFQQQYSDSADSSLKQNHYSSNHNSIANQQNLQQQYYHGPIQYQQSQKQYAQPSSIENSLVPSHQFFAPHDSQNVTSTDVFQTGRSQQNFQQKQGQTFLPNLNFPNKQVMGSRSRLADTGREIFGYGTSSRGPMLQHVTKLNERTIENNTFAPTPDDKRRRANDYFGTTSTRIGFGGSIQVHILIECFLPFLLNKIHVNDRDMMRGCAHYIVI